MKRPDILTLLKNNFAHKSTSGDRLLSENYETAINVALRSLEKTRPNYKDGTLTLVAGQSLYAGPADFVMYDYSNWSSNSNHNKKSYLNGTGIPPRISTLRRNIHFAPAPTASQLSLWGCEFAYIYSAKHVLNDIEDETTLLDEDEGLLLLRATAELMGVLANRNVVDPVQLHQGIGNVPTSGTPGTMYNALMAEYRKQAGSFIKQGGSQ